MFVLNRRLEAHFPVLSGRPTVQGYRAGSLGGAASRRLARLQRPSFSTVALAQSRSGSWPTRDVTESRSPTPARSGLRSLWQAAAQGAPAGAPNVPRPLHREVPGTLQAPTPVCWLRHVHRASPLPPCHFGAAVFASCCGPFGCHLLRGMNVALRPRDLALGRPVATGPLRHYPGGTHTRW